MIPSNVVPPYNIERGFDDGEFLNDKLIQERFKEMQNRVCVFLLQTSKLDSMAETYPPCGIPIAQFLV